MQDVCWDERAIVGKRRELLHTEFLIIHIGISTIFRTQVLPPKSTDSAFVWLASGFETNNEKAPHPADHDGRRRRLPPIPQSTVGSAYHYRSGEEAEVDAMSMSMSMSTNDNLKPISYCPRRSVVVLVVMRRDLSAL